MQAAWRESDDQAAFVRASWHEAGHAVVARALGRRVTLVEVDRSGRRGSCYLDLDRADRRAVQDELAILVAGEVAVELAAGRDWKQLRLAQLVERETRGRPFAPGEVPTGEIREAGHRAAGILERRWLEVDELQGELLMDGSVLEREMNGARPRAVGDRVVMSDGKWGRVGSAAEAHRVRMGELLALEWGPEGLDLDAGIVSVRATLDRVRDADGVYKRVAPKSRAGRRAVPTPAEDVSRLLRHRLASGRPDGGEPVFASETGEPLSPVPAYRAFKRACVRAGIAAPLPRPHDARHAFATHALAAGLSAHAVAQLLGHSDPGLVWRRYGHALPAEVAGAGDALSAWRTARKAI